MDSRQTNCNSWISEIVCPQTSIYGRGPAPVFWREEYLKISIKLFDDGGAVDRRRLPTGSGTLLYSTTTTTTTTTFRHKTNLSCTNI